MPLVAVVAVAASTLAACGRPPRGAAPSGGEHAAPPRGEHVITTTTGARVTPTPAGNHGDESGATLDGARAAGLRYLALAEQVTEMREDVAEAVQRDAASSGAADSLVADLRRRLADLRQAYPAGPVHYRVGPVAARVVATGAGRALVDIYYVGIVSPPAVAPYEEWRTAHYDLVWERGRWRVAAESSTPGPRPTVAVRVEPVSSEGLEAALAGFTSVAAG